MEEEKKGSKKKLIPAPGIILVEANKENNITEHGILVPDINENVCKVTVSAVGKLEKMDLSEGDVIYVHDYHIQGEPVIIQCNHYHVFAITEEEILAVEQDA